MKSSHPQLSLHILLFFISAYTLSFFIGCRFLFVVTETCKNLFSGRISGVAAHRLPVIQCVQCFFSTQSFNKCLFMHSLKNQCCTRRVCWTLMDFACCAALVGAVWGTHGSQDSVTVISSLTAVHLNSSERLQMGRPRMLFP